MDNPWIKQESLQLYLRNQLSDHISLFCLGLPALPDAQSHGITRIYGLADDWAAWLEVLTAVTMCTKCHLGHPGPQSPASVGSALAVGQAGLEFCITHILELILTASQQLSPWTCPCRICSLSNTVEQAIIRLPKWSTEMGLLCEIYQVGIFYFIQNGLNFKQLSNMQGKYESGWKECQKCS